MSTAPAVPRAVAFFDGQNLFHAVREAFGYRFPNYDPLALAKCVCAGKGWTVAQTRFYTGVPEPFDNARWNGFWAAKLLVMSRAGAYTYRRALRYRTKTFDLPNGSKHSVVVGEEKGIDVRIAIDVIRLAHASAYDVAVIFSQDQDLREAAEEVRLIAREQKRFIKVASAFPVGPAYHNTRGIDKTDWIRIDRATYDGCLDARSYRAKP